MPNLEAIISTTTGLFPENFVNRNKLKWVSIDPKQFAKYNESTPGVPGCVLLEIF
ncbi:hypothetical protein T11_17683 [Trichinella zimbabwensis]|uniref:Uncharacterized protein n=1 Tax=Trichinella zimbabwensis TaxID=268475 RepID=A0A0V1GMS0_9BILA|nr:hypothetical protein T11_17683 [Trichinella zimbabwensis]